MALSGTLWGMKKALYAVMVSVGLSVSSCAYVQTHKNVEELGSYIEGKVLNKESIGLYKQGEQWYVSATPARFKLSHPTVHDTVFRKNDVTPELKLIAEKKGNVVYHPVSPYAAQILQRSDGYFQLRALSDEIQRTGGAWVEQLPGARHVPIAAEVAGKKNTFFIEEERVPKNKPLWSKALGTVDFIVVDIPASLVYNVAIPIMAPFVFFYEFAHED